MGFEFFLNANPKTLKRGINEYPFGYIFVESEFPKRQKNTPSLIAHIGFGPLSFLTGIMIYQLSGEIPAQIYKLSSQERYFIPYYLSELEKIDPQLASVLSVVYWKGGDSRIERIIYRQSDVIIPYGSSETIKSVVKAARPWWSLRKPFIITNHGTKIGRGFHEGEFTEDDAFLYAFDASVFFGVSCFNLKILYVEGDEKTAVKVAEKINTKLELFSQKFGNIQNSLWTSSIGYDIDIFWRKLVENQQKIYRSNYGFITFYPGYIAPPDKGIIVGIIPVNSRSELIDTLSRLPEDDKQTFVTNVTDLDFLEKLARVGFNRICMPGDAPYPKPGPHDGTIDAYEILYGPCPRMVMIELQNSSYEAYRFNRTNRLRRDFNLYIS